ncbi:MAG TPA: TonB-dependent receptor, partial [Flavisolibacter sp.]|nr:TonB-dependent receptor [Flavisolibacter sp.]
GNSRQFLAMLGLAVFDSESSEMEPSFYVSSHANFLSNFSLQFAVPGFSFGINGLYKTRQEQAAPAIKAAVSKDYFLLNVKGEGFIIPKKLSLFVQVDNIFDRSYSDLLGTPMPGRWFMGGLKLSLIK